MQIVCFILGMMCFVYFLILFSIGMDFSIVWLVATAMFVGVALVSRVAFPSAVRIGTYILAGGLLLLFFCCEALIISGMRKPKTEPLDAIIILGAQIHGEMPSRALLYRLKAAEEAWKVCGEPIMVLSGGRGEDEAISEAECMRRVLVADGIPEDKLILEDASTNTEENLRFSGKLLESTSGRIGIVSNNFHIYRALRLARKQGYTNVVGVPGESDWRYQVHYMVREAFALVKEKLVGNI